MLCKIHGEYTGLQCRHCFIFECEQRELRHFKTDSIGTFKTILRGGKEHGKYHAVISGWGTKTLCGQTFSSLSGLSFAKQRDADKGDVTCSGCLKVGWG